MDDTIRETLLEALRPFADAARELDDGIAPDLRADDDLFVEEALFKHQQPTVRDLRRAWNAVAWAGGFSQ